MDVFQIGMDIKVNNSRPRVAWHHKIYPTDLGFLFFVIEAEYGRKGPFKIQLKIFEYQTEKISTVKEFKCGNDEDELLHIYLLEGIEGATISCHKMDDLINILDKKFVCLWMQEDDKGKMNKV